MEIDDILNKEEITKEDFKILKQYINDLQNDYVECSKQKKKGINMNINVIPRGTDEAKVIQLIETKSLIGSGNTENPVRIILQYWDFEGNLMAEKDTLKI